MQKRGMSNTVAIILLIFTALAAIIIIWAVVKTIVTNTAISIEQESQLVLLNVEIIKPSTTINSTNDIILTIKRKQGGNVTISGVIIILEDGKGNIARIENRTLGSFETLQTILITILHDTHNLANVTKISIYPAILDTKNKLLPTRYPTDTYQVKSSTTGTSTPGTPNQECGNEITEGSEQCDNGIINNGVCPKTCSSSCTINTCPITCTSKTDCPTGYVCTNSACTIGPTTCTDSLQCGNGQICTNEGICAPPIIICSTNTQCEIGKICSNNNCITGPTVNLKVSINGGSAQEGSVTSPVGFPASGDSLVLSWTTNQAVVSCLADGPTGFNGPGWAGSKNPLGGTEDIIDTAQPGDTAVLVYLINCANAQGDVATDIVMVKKSPDFGSSHGQLAWYPVTLTVNDSHFSSKAGPDATFHIHWEADPRYDYCIGQSSDTVNGSGMSGTITHWSGPKPTTGNQDLVIHMFPNGFPLSLVARPSVRLTCYKTINDIPYSNSDQVWMEIITPMCYFQPSTCGTSQGGTGFITSGNVDIKARKHDPTSAYTDMPLKTTKTEGVDLKWTSNFPNYPNACNLRVILSSSNIESGGYFVYELGDFPPNYTLTLPSAGYPLEGGRHFYEVGCKDKTPYSDTYVYVKDASDNTQVDVDLKVQLYANGQKITTINTPPTASTNLSWQTDVTPYDPANPNSRWGSCTGSWGESITSQSKLPNGNSQVTVIPNPDFEPPYDNNYGRGYTITCSENDATQSDLVLVKIHKSSS
ncbi:MAG: hypothetical protein Q7S74_00355 [Nanoarchaeota archaeon]|nr:hypothetical protein [Nanoarchaeota archaeon]